MKKTPREWMLDRDRDALPRLERIRQAVLAPVRASFMDTVLELFRPNLPAWTALVLAWIALATAHFAFVAAGRNESMRPGMRQDLTNLILTHDEALSLLDSHP